MTKALLIFSGWNDRAVLAILRVAARVGAPVAIIARSPDDPVLLTRYRRQVVHVRGTPTLALDEVGAAIATARQRLGVDGLVVYPSSEFLNGYLMAHRDELAALGCHVPLVDVGLYREISDKKSATRLLVAHGFEIPRERSGPGDRALPMVAKPRLNQSAGSGKSLYPQLLFDQADLDRFLRTEPVEEYFFQDYVDGMSRYLLLHRAGNGAIRSFSQCNLVQQPGGKSIVHAAADTLHRSDLARRFFAMLEEKDFHGLLMAEFILAGDKEYFIEINPRPWGPLQLSVDCGAGILEAFLGDCLHGDPARYAPAAPSDRPFAWIGGVLESWAAGTPVVWRQRRPRLAWLRWLALLPRDIYIRRDSWRVFAREFTRALGKKLAGPTGVRGA
jgi:hypothetical protein